ncbi:prenyltransferase/squalene oxidase repeat-containing protein [Aeromicrobium sp. A1-2]|uniref:prenyltransferase/squalene oxidase repeat-containing protein n=1 Tax=Aeromicrobium sp. A1-2 TaxID=2107713 RepID=UPI0013C2AE0E|nr:prenyltransferase/squalene oxidase repeat-containing protein [Aeromicrobium sp. A1-2]
MSRRIVRRLLALTVAIPLAVLTVSPAAAAPTPAASSAAAWLSGELTGGLAHNPNYGGFDDYGLSLDIFFALDSLGAEQGAAASILDAVASNPAAYIGYEPSIYAGALGKLATAVDLGGRDPRAFGGADLIDRAEKRVMLDGPAAGRATDAFDPEDPWGGDYSNSIGQAWVVRALAAADSPLADDVTDYLIKQQCDDGSVRVTMSDDPCTAGSGTVDGTAFAVQALAVADEKGQAGLADSISAGVTWLLGQQKSDGSFDDEGSANTNSTGLAAATLAQVGQKTSAQKAAAWILSRQVTTKNSSGTALKKQIGAIAFDQAALTAGKADGITDATSDQWRRASAQAAIGLNIAIPATPDDSTAGGSTTGGSTAGGSASSDSSTSGGTTTGGPAAAGVAVGAAAEPEPTPTPTPEPTATPTPVDDSADTVVAEPTSASTDGSMTGWIVAGIAAVLMLGTAGAVGIGRLRGGGV